MNAQQLYLENGASADIYFCEKCRKVSANQQVSEECCTPRFCDTCKVNPCETYFYTCPVCKAEKAAQWEANRFEKSEKLTEWDGPVYLDGAGGNEGYFDSLEELHDWIACEGFTQENCPAYCWAAFENPFVRVNIDNVIENSTRDAYEDWDDEGLVGVPEFKAACEAFNTANTHHTFYAINYAKSIAINYEKSQSS